MLGFILGCMHHAGSKCKQAKQHGREGTDIWAQHMYDTIIIA